MAKKKANTEPSEPRPERGNYISEWFGYRVYPSAYTGVEAGEAWKNELCPYLSRASGEPINCYKGAKSKGVCSISTLTPLGRRNWLVCPTRAFDPSLVNKAVEYLFNVAPGERTRVIPAMRLKRPEGRTEMAAALADGERVFLYLEAKAGGEVSLGKTDKSPEFSFDVTILEVLADAEGPYISRFGALEIQTMDFHGSYEHAVKNLKGGLHLHPDNFPETLDGRQWWISDRIEGPNLSNVFKRTFYQMAFKFQLGKAEGCAGTVLALPKAVWESWRPHLGDPTIEGGERAVLSKPGVELPSRPIAWIFSFDLDHTPSGGGPDKVRVEQIIETSAEALAYWALEVAPENALAHAATPEGFPTSVRRRLRPIWKELASNIRFSGRLAGPPRGA